MIEQFYEAIKELQEQGMLQYAFNKAFEDGLLNFQSISIQYAVHLEKKRRTLTSERDNQTNIVNNYFKTSPGMKPKDKQIMEDWVKAYTYCIEIFEFIDGGNKKPDYTNRYWKPMVDHIKQVAENDMQKMTHPHFVDLLCRDGWLINPPFGDKSEQLLEQFEEKTGIAIR